MNESIECVLKALSAPAFSTPVRNDLERSNTDQDRWEFHSLEECRVDGYDTPLVYIPHSLYGHGPFVVARADGERVRVRAVRRAAGTYYNTNTYQLISLGRNGKQDAPESDAWDDICNFTLSGE